MFRSDGINPIDKNMLKLLNLELKNISYRNVDRTWAARCKMQ